MKDWKKRIKSQLEDLEEQLSLIEADVRKINKTEQFDFCTDAELADRVSSVYYRAEHLFKFVYQED